MTPEVDLLTPLRDYWGYNSFRPLQERIVNSLASGHDACVVMPTGGGKSLCYQLPALIGQKTAIVISPFIALMQDQVDNWPRWAFLRGLQQLLTGEEQNRIMRQAGPVRIACFIFARAAAARDTLGWLQNFPFPFSPSMKPTASRSGVTNFALSIVS